MFNWTEEGKTIQKYLKSMSMLVASQVMLVVKNLPGSVGDIRDTGLIPELGRSPEEGMATNSNILAWRIPWTEEPGGLQSVGLQSRTRLK